MWARRARGCCGGADAAVPFGLTLLLASGLLQLLWNDVVRASRRTELVLWQALVACALLSLPLACWNLSELGRCCADSVAVAYLLGSGALQAAYFVALSLAYRSGDLSAVLPLSRGVGIAG